MTPVAMLTDAPTPEAERTIGEGLAGFSAAQAGYRDSRKLAIVVTDTETGQVIGGLTGRTSYGLLFIDIFFLPDSLRGQGLGGRILRLAEDEARTRGCITAMLYTISFQAPGFYEKHGYRIFGSVECLPPGTSRIFMTKTL